MQNNKRIQPCFCWTREGLNLHWLQREQDHAFRAVSQTGHQWVHTPKACHISQIPVKTWRIKTKLRKMYKCWYLNDWGAAPYMMQYLTYIGQYLVSDLIFSFDLNIARSNLRVPLAASANSGCVFKTHNSQWHFFSFSINHGTQHTLWGTTFPCTAYFIFIIFLISCKSIRFKLCCSHLQRYRQTSEYLRVQPGHCDFWEGNQCLTLHLEKSAFCKAIVPHKCSHQLLGRSPALPQQLN